MAAIGDVFLRLLADDAGFKADVQKKAQAAGDAGAATLGQRLSSGLRGAIGVGLKGAGLAAAAAFGVASKGAIDLENIVADLQATTGATAEEAREAGKAINSIAGRNRADLLDVADAAKAVRTDLGLMGEEANAVTDQFVRFARVTKQNAGEAVRDFDDILDAWNLTAADAGPLMDKLLVSTQRFGGSVSQRQKDLAALAPQLKALNLDVDDGVGLLNLFAASGIDASKAQRALNSAVQKLPPGTSLENFIAQLAAIEDPAERARRAVEVFGSRGGVELANAIRPGRESLDEFGISAADAAGATQKAADIIDNTLTGRIQRAVSEAGAALRGFGADVGPALTGAASAASLAGSLGFGRLGGKLGTALLAGFKDIGRRLAAVLGVQLASSAVAGAASTGGEEIGNLSARAIERRLKGRAASKAIGDGLIGSMEAAAPRVEKGAGRLGGRMGRALGLGIAAAAAFAWLEVLNTYNEQQGEIESQTNDIGEAIGNQIAQGSLDQLRQSRAAVAKGLQDLYNIRDFGLLTGDAKARLEQELLRLDKAIAERMAGGLENAVDQKTPTFNHAGQQAAFAIRDGIEGVDYEPTGEQIPGEISRGIVSGFNEVEQGLEDLKELIKNALSPTKKIARLEAILTGKAITAGLKDSRPEVRTAAQQLALDTIAQLAPLKPDSREIGRQVSQLLASGMTLEQVKAQLAAAGVSKVIIDKLGLAPPAARETGKKVPTETAAGIDANRGGVVSAVDRLERVAEGFDPDMETAGKSIPTELAKWINSPAGRQAILTAVQRLAGIVNQFLRFITGGAPTTRSSPGGTFRGRQHGGWVSPTEWYAINESRGGPTELFRPSMAGRITPSMGELTPVAAAGETNNYHLTVVAPDSARDPFALVRHLQRYGETGQLTTRLRPVLRKEPV